jgi:inosose dehydratase
MNTHDRSSHRTIATQLYVWSQVCRREGSSLEERLEPVLGEVAAAGFTAFEAMLPASAATDTRERLQAALRSHGLTVTSFYSGGTFHEDAAFQEYAAQTLLAAPHARDMRAQALCINPNVSRTGKTDEELRRQARNLNHIGEKLRRLGLELWLHNHDPEMRDDARELRSTLENTDPELVRYCADVHWIFRGGGDPYDYLERYGPRLGSLHVRNSHAGVWSEEFGDGDIDYRRIRAILDRHAFTGPIIVELAIEAGTPRTRSLVESARLSREYARATLSD